ncbi:serine/threonine-protein kinase [Actinosynnema sp. ALI-1.44]|uniref:serine/threonine-protein kinase n=1 Tax=Actinosynnema sp. ALI-1.44 TaxID=1933779 RepID=UPI001EDC702F|nr:serine/threonine-protein kinase [Actinosynnema sp. ALI-1.44]
MARWHPVHVLGSGAFGQVYLAWDTADQRYVAVKHFTGHDELDLLRFVIESRIRVNHPHLVRTVAFRLVDDEAWLVTELARGGSLRPLLNRGPQPLGWVVEVIDQTLDALGALHASGVVHRDVKPANILLRDPGTSAPYALVGDFGIAAWRTVSMTGVGAAIGTLGYLAPEYLNGTQPSPQTDLFAVGVLAAELLGGRRLIHQSNSTPDLPGNWHDDLVPLLDGIPGHLTNVLRRMAAPDPSRRYADCAAALEALRYASPSSTRQDLTSVEAADLLVSVPAPPAVPVPAPTQPVNKPIPTPLPAPTPPPARRKRRFPWIVVSGATVLTAATVGLILLLGNEKSPSNGPTSWPGKQTNAPAVAWTPQPLETCSRVDIGRLRQNNTQRCQRTSGTTLSWVIAPVGGFPAPSNPAGPFAGEPCTPEGSQDYSPTGARLTCRAKSWQG